MIVQAPDNKTIDFGDLPQDQVTSAMSKLYPSTGSDVAKGVGSGLVTDALAASPAGALDLGLHAIPTMKNAAEYLGTKAANAVTGKDTQPQYVEQPPSVIDKMTSGAMGAAGQGALTGAMGGDFVGYDPKTTMGKIAKGGTEIAPVLAGVGVGGAKKAGEAFENYLDKSAAKLVTPENASLLATARQYDIPVFRSQVSKSQPTKMAGSFMKDIPFSGAEGKVTEQVEKFNEAVMSELGGKGQVTHENLGKTYDRLSGNYDKLTGKYNIKVTPELDNKLLDLSDKAHVALAGDPAKLNAFNEYWNLTIDNMKSGEISGKTYQRIRSGIGSTLRGDGSSPELGQLQNLIDSHFQSNMSKADADLFQTTRDQYRNMIAVEKVLKTGAQDQGISPVRLQNAVKQVFGDYAYGGKSGLEQLARLGTILKDTFPQSGTAPRNLANDVAKELAKKGAGALVGFGGAGVPVAAARYAGTPYLYQNIAESPSAQSVIDQFMGGSNIKDVLKQLQYQPQTINVPPGGFEAVPNMLKLMQQK